MFCGTEPCSSQKSRSPSLEQRPLRSVENQLDLTSHGVGGVGTTHSGSHRHASGHKMNKDTFHNNNTTISTKICTEPIADHYTIDEEIGRGKFAVVKRCRRHQNNKVYAAKYLRKRRKGKDCRHDILHEISMLEMARLHPRLVDLVEVFETTNELIVITEYAQGGELYQQVVLEERIEEKEVIRLMRQILEGLVFLHDRNTVHLDVKPQNILLTNRLPYGDIKLCDFGFARKVYSGEDVRDIIGTPDYVAPEVLSYEPIHTASDMWSVGVLAYVMLTGYSPFAADTKQETFLNISQVNIDFPEDLFEDISSGAQEFMMKLLVREPGERLVARDCLNHPWLQSEDLCLTLMTQSPFGSPIGHRRALTPPTPDGTLEEEPLKKCKCDGDSQSSEQEKLENGQLSDDSSPVDENNPNITPRTHVTMKSLTPRILEESNKCHQIDISSPSSSSPHTPSTAPRVYTTTAHVEIGGVRKELKVTSERGQGQREGQQELVYTPDKNCLAQVDVEKEIFC